MGEKDTARKRERRGVRSIGLPGSHLIRSTILEGTLQDTSKSDNASIAISGIFGKRFENDFLDSFRERRIMITQRRRGYLHVLIGKGQSGAFKGTNATEPFVSHDGQGILIAGIH